jgi:SAM-dependent methyltransferase
MDSAGQKGGKQESKYTFGYDSSVVDYLRFRAKRCADFVIPHLRPGMRLLDCGCGPGAITTELAKAVAPGEVIGIDLEGSQIDIARRHAEEIGMTNLRFEAADLFELPYPDESFDAVFAHAVLVKALWRRRVNRAPFRTVVKGGRFKGIQPSVSWEQPLSLDEWPQFYAGWAQVSSGTIGKIIREQGWANKERLDQIISGWKKFGEDRAGFVASGWREALGWKV